MPTEKHKQSTLGRITSDSGTQGSLLKGMDLEWDLEWW